jgi:hypothetical protein
MSRVGDRDHWVNIASERREAESVQRAHKLFVQRRNGYVQKMNVQERANRILVTCETKKIVLKIVGYNHNVIQGVFR